MRSILLTIAALLVASPAGAHGLDEPLHAVALTPTSPDAQLEAISTDFGLLVQREDGLELFADEGFDGEVNAYAIVATPDGARWFAATTNGLFASRDAGCSWQRSPIQGDFATELAVDEGGLWVVTETAGGPARLERNEDGERFVTVLEATGRELGPLGQSADGAVWLGVRQPATGEHAIYDVATEEELPGRLVGVGADRPLLADEVDSPDVRWAVEHEGELTIGFQRTVELPTGEVVEGWGIGLGPRGVWRTLSTDRNDHMIAWSDGTVRAPFADIYPTRCAGETGEATRAIFPTLERLGLRPPGTRASADDGCGCGSTRSVPLAPLFFLVLGVVRLTRRTTWSADERP